MSQNPKLEKMGSDNLSLICQAGEFEEKESGKFSGSDHVNSSLKSDSFVVDMEHFSHFIEENIMNANSRITMNLSRKGSARGGGEPTTTNERNTTMLATSTTATLHGGGKPEKPAVVAVGATNEPAVHHQITIKNPNLSTTVAEMTRGSKRFGFRHSPLTWFFSPRRIVFLFATLSSMGSILLIYFTLTMTKFNGDENGLN